MPEHPSALMRRAASLLREAGSAATPPPWRVSFADGDAPVVDGPGPDGHIVAEMYRCGYPEHEGRQKADATLITLLRNSAVALAGWLEQEADKAERATVMGWCRNCGGIHGRNCACWDGALSVAREILGEQEGGR